MAAESALAKLAASEWEGPIDSAAVGSSAVGSAAVGSTAMGSTAAGSTTVGSTAVGSSVLGSLATGWMASSSPAISLSAANASTASTAIASAALFSTTDDRDPYAEWGSDSGSSGLGDDRMCEYPIDSEEAEIREAEVRVEHRAACEQRRVRAEIEAAERAAADAQACEQNRVHTEIMAAQQAAAYAQASCLALPTNDRDEVDGWMRDYEINKLRTSVHNEQHLLSLNLIDPSCLSRTKYRLERALELQRSQEALVHERLGHALATAAILHAIQEFYYY